MKSTNSDQANISGNEKILRELDLPSEFVFYSIRYRAPKDEIKIMLITNQALYFMDGIKNQIRNKILIQELSDVTVSLCTKPQKIVVRIDEKTEEVC